MQPNYLKNILRTAVHGATVLLLGAGMASAQQQINLTAAATTTTLPDGSVVPMWGYSCGAVVTGSTATCKAANPTATTWSPVIITVPSGQDLAINLTNNLPVPPSATTGIPTSLVIVGQLGGGLGVPTKKDSPNHDNQPTTWPIANSGAIFTPPAQGQRVQSFSTEVATGASATALTWTKPREGTYLLESGTHPSIQASMGLIGMVVVTAAPAVSTPGTAYTTGGTGTPVTYSADVPLIFSEIDPVQNRAVDKAVNTGGFVETATRGPLAAGGIANINIITGGAGYTAAPTVGISGGGGTGATATADIDTDSTSSTFGQVLDVVITAAGSGYTSAPTITFTGPVGHTGATATAAAFLTLANNSVNNCSVPGSTTPAGACYPPVVNYTPLYYLINGVAFNKTSGTTSLFPTAPASSVTGNVLVRMVNAGSRMHIPSIVGSVTGTAGGFSLIAEDGNPLPGTPRVQSEVFMAAGKTYDVMITAPATVTTALPVFDRELSLSGNATSRDAGMLAYISINGAGLPSAPSLGAATANPDSYSVVPSETLTVTDPAKGLIANDINIYGVKVLAAPTKGTLTLNADGTFQYVPGGSWAPDSFTYCGNGATSGAACNTVTLSAATIELGIGITMGNAAYTSNVAKSIKIGSPGPLQYDKDAAGYPLTVAPGSVAPAAGLNVTVDKSGGFVASVGAAGTYTFTYKAQNSQGTVSSTSATVTLTFQSGSGLAVTVKDPDPTKPVITDYRWIIEEDRTFFVDPTKTTNTGGSTIVPTFGTNFHTSYMPVVATGCTGDLSCELGQSVLGTAAVCDVGNGVCRTDATKQAKTSPADVHLDPTKRYYISVLPGDAANPFNAGNLSSTCSTDSNGVSSCGHGMGGAPIAAGQAAVTVLTEPTPLQPSKLSVFVFQDDFPLNGEQDAGGGVDVLSPNEPGLGQFNITIMDDAGGTGDATGQVDYDMFNQPLSNSLDGTVDPATGLNACPITTQGKTNPAGITGMIVTCPKYEDGLSAGNKVLSPLAGQAVVANMMPGRYGVIATPGADRIARGEEWLQTNTLDGQKAHDSFLRVGEPSFFQEFGPAGYHVSIGFANPAIIKARKAGVCNQTDPNITGTNCTNSVTGLVTTERMSRTPDERLYSSGTNDSFGFTQCYVSFGDPDGEDFDFTKCNADGTFTLTGLPDGDWRVTVFDQWNDMLVDGLSTPVRLAGGKTTDLGDIATNQWQANISTNTFFDKNGNGVRDPGEDGLSLVDTNIRFRDGSFSNFNSTDLAGNAGFNEEFPLFSWYVIETDSTRYKNTGIHVVYDAGGPADGTCTSATAPCGSSNIAANMANTWEAIPVPTALRVPGAFYCLTADCTDAPTPLSVTGASGSGPGGSTGRVDPPWVATEGWQGYSGQNNFLEFGKKPFAVGENGGIHGHVVYASTRPFDDPQLLLQTSWMPEVPNVTINLYQEGAAPDGTVSLKLVDTTKTSSFDDWAQGFRSDGVPNMNCPGQGRDTGTNADLFFFSLFNQPNYLDVYNSQHGGPAPTTLPNNSQFKCYDGMHTWNQLQPAPYDGMYQFPSVTAMNPTTGAPTGTNCTACIPNPDASDPYRFGKPMLPKGKYVVEVVVPQGYELVKEEDKNILIGDNFIAPVTVQFPGLGGSIFILPDQASVSTGYNSNNPQNSTNDLGRNSTLPSHEADTGSVESYWPCVGASRVVPDFISLFPGSAEVAPFAGATRNLCDRKEVTLDDQTAALAKFYIFTSTHVAAHFTGVITDDFTSEFDPFSPQFGEKFAPPDLPVAFKDWAGNEISRVYADHWGAYNGLTYSTWEVNPPNPTGYSPTMMVTCMNDAGTGVTPDPLYNPQYSQFCYELPFMPGQTAYLDTPVVPTSGFAGAGYNNPDCAYPALTPAIKEVDGDGVGPWVLAADSTSAHHTLTITALGDQQVPNNAYTGPSATTPPYNQKTILRHYGFGGTKGSVSIGGVAVTAANITTWNDTTIVLNVPSGIPACGIPQQAQYGGPGAAGVTNALCGELNITTADGKQSIDTVTVTVGGKPPTHVGASASIQAAIDSAKPGDLLIIDPAVHTEMLLMWKPVRLQGVGAASSILNANTHPAGKMDDWRRKVDCLFGLALDGQPSTQGLSGAANTNPFDPTGTYTCGGWTGFNGSNNNPQVDRLPLEGILGWDTTVNGNLAQLLQEPTLMGAYEGAGVTVLAKGVKLPPGATNIFGSGSESAFPAGTTLLTASDCGGIRTNTPANKFPSNFQCNPSAIDGLSVTNSSQGGGGIFVHAWGHNLQIANNRVYNNTGTLTGGITIGQGESPDAYLVGDAGNADPGSCETAGVTGSQLPYCFDTHVNLHNNFVSSNSSIGDELFSSTPAGAGGVTMCVGADYYLFNYNWVCGNLSSGDGGGFVHLGFIKQGDIEHNSILFNQSTNPTVPTNGGGMIVMGAPPDGLTATGLECGNTVADADCTPGLSDGTGPNLTINANLIMGNSADSGSGGGIRFQGVNGTDVVNFPTRPALWNNVSVTNNIVTNNVAGWDGAGISLLDALDVNIVNNTIESNDTTASSGVLFNTLGAPLSSSQGPTCTSNCGTTSAPQPAGLVSIQNSAVLTSSIPATITCPAGHFAPATSATNGTCRAVSYPLLDNNVFYQNRAFYIGVGALGSGTLSQQNVVTLYNAFTTTTPASQTATGGCPAGVSYWDIGVRGDTGPTNHASTVTLNPTFSVLTNITGYPGTGNTQAAPTVASEYCNGSRIPPEFGGTGYQVPPGISDATVPNPVFALTPAATVDEGNNWINLSWGPLSLTNPATNATLGNYSPVAGSSVINRVPSSASGALGAYTLAPSVDFFGNPRKTNNAVDAGAVEFLGAAATATLSVTGGPLAFGNQATGTTSASQQLTLHNTGTATANTIAVVVTAPFARPAGAAGGSCGATLNAGATCSINVVFSPTALGAANGTATITANVAVTGSPVGLTGTGVAPVTAATLTPTSHNFGNAARGIGLLGPSQVFTLTNTGNVTLTGIGRGTLGGTSSSEYAVVGLLSTCGPAAGTQLVSTTTLAPGANCVVTVQFRPVAAQGTGVKNATVSVTDAAGTQTSTLTGTAQ